MNDVTDMLIEQAGGQQAPDLDVDAIMRSGTRRRRLRRTMGGLAVAAVAAGLVAGGLTLLPEGSSVDPAHAPRLPFAADVPTWADGDTIHYGSEQITVRGGQIDAFVRTDAGFVYVTRTGTVHVADGSDEQLVGRNNKLRRLATDDTGTFVTWTEQTGPTEEAMVYDVAERHIAHRSGGSQALGIDGDNLYLTMPDQQVARRRLSTGDTQIVPGSAAGWRDVAAARFAFNPPSDGPVMVGDNLTPDGRRFDGWLADLSPNGSLLLTEGNDITRLYDAGSGAARELSHRDHPIVFPAGWLDDDRFVLMGLTATDPAPGTPVDLLTCSATDGSCSVSAPAFTKYTEDDEDWTIRFPTGRSFTNP